MKPKEEETCLDTKEKVQGQGGDSDQEMMNLENELYSLTHYADDEEELVAQMFATIKGSKLEAMMPPILKEIPLIDVQQLCLHELRGMSQRRILSIINGQEMSGSSSEDSESEKKANYINENEDSNAATKSVEGENEDIFTGKDLSELENINESSLTTLDILELEMRAKLIKTMLEKQDGDEGKGEESGGGGEEKGEGANGFVPDIKIKEEPLTPENTQVEDKKDNVSEDRSPGSTRKNRRKKRKYHRRSDSRSYSSSRSSSRSSYTSRSRSRTRSTSGSRSPSFSRSISYTPERRKEGSESPKSKKATKKKISKKEFEERMKKAKMNRTYRKRKESEEETGETIQIKKEPNENEDPSENPPDQVQENNTEPTEDKNAEQAEVGEEGQAEEGEIEEKEEGEIDSNEDVWSRSSRSYSRSYSSDSYSSCSSRSRSYSRSPKRRKSKKSKKRHRRRRSRSTSLSDVPKIPNWKPNESTVVNIDKSDSDIADSKISTSPKPVITLPDKEERQTISFSIGKKSNTAAKDASELNVDTNTSTSIPEDNEQGTNVEGGDSKETTVIKIESEKSLKIESKDSKPQEGAEVTEDFYEGVNQLSISEGECEDDKISEKNLNNNNPTDTVEKADSSNNLSENIKSVSTKKIRRKRKKKLSAYEGEAIKSRELANIDSVPEESNDIPKDVEEVTEELSQLSSLPDIGQDSTQDVLEPLPETEAEDSRESHSLEIIGVIDPAEKPDDTFDELSAGGSSWSMRWLQSEKVQKVVSNSKMLSKVRKKIQAKGKGIVKDVPKTIPKQTVVETKPESPKIEIKLQQPKPASNVIGSIEEYEKLFGIKVKAPTSLPQPKPQAKPAAVAAVSQAASLLDSDDEEDSEEEAIWSKIMKK